MGKDIIQVLLVKIDRVDVESFLKDKIEAWYADGLQTTTTIMKTGRFGIALLTRNITDDNIQEKDELLDFMERSLFEFVECINGEIDYIDVEEHLFSTEHLLSDMIFE